MKRLGFAFPSMDRVTSKAQAVLKDWASYFPVWTESPEKLRTYEKIGLRISQYGQSHLKSSGHMKKLGFVFPSMDRVTLKAQAVLKDWASYFPVWTESLEKLRTYEKIGLRISQ